jgi:HlyD family secretion protein
MFKVRANTMAATPKKKPQRVGSELPIRRLETPELNGEVSQISADISEDKKSGQNFYTVRIRVSDDELARAGNVKLVPGMPVDAYIQTTSRTMMSYLVRPMADQLRKAFRDK